MAQIKPFKGLIYNPELPIEKLVAPPYDVISESERDELYELHPYNVIRLILNRDEDRYKSAKYYFDEWLKNGILLEKEKEGVYVYEQDFEIDGNKYTRIGVICLMKLEEFGKGKIFPHEKTFPKPKEDRFNLLKETNAQFDHIFGIYPDPEFKIENLIFNFKPQKPLFNFEFPSGSNIWHRLYEITEEDFINKIISIFNDLPVFIADGHHRYEVGLMFRDYMASLSKAKGEHNYILTYLTNMESQGLVILPTHRVLLGVEKGNLRKKISSELLKNYFEIYEINLVDELKELLKRTGKGCLGIYFGHGESLFLKIKEQRLINSHLPEDIPEPVKNLDVTILHEFIFKMLEIETNKIKIAYTHEFKKAIELAEERDRVAFLLNPPLISDIKNVSLSGATMPQKSTYFYPKVLSGIVMRKF